MKQVHSMTVTKSKAFKGYVAYAMITNDKTNVMESVEVMHKGCRDKAIKILMDKIIKHVQQDDLLTMCLS